jgi:predicted dehydrogenase
VPIDTINVLFTLASPPVTDTTPETPKNTPPHGVFQLSYASPLKARNENRIAVTGTKGFLEITSFNIPLLGPHWRLTIHSGRGTNDATEEIVEKNQGVEQELHHFAKLILGKGDDGFGHLKGALADVEFIEKSLKSGGAELKLDATSGL